MEVRAESRVVLSSLQMLVAQVAVALCSDAREMDLGEWEARRVPLGGNFAGLARRLAAARDLDDRANATLTSFLDEDGQPVLAVELVLVHAESDALTVAAERMRGVIAATDEFGGVVADELDQILGALA